MLHDTIILEEARGRRLWSAQLLRLRSVRTGQLDPVLLGRVVCITDLIRLLPLVLARRFVFEEIAAVLGGHVPVSHHLHALVVEAMDALRVTVQVPG